MQKLAKFFLWLLTLVVPVFIAACYGPSQRYTRGGQPQRAANGRVVQRDTGQALAGIAVNCLQAGRIALIGSSAADGSYTLFDPYACDRLVFEDRDGPANHGRHVSRMVTFDPDAPPATVVLEVRPD